MSHEIEIPLEKMDGPLEKPDTAPLATATSPRQGTKSSANRRASSQD